MSQRKTYYNPILDPDLQERKMTKKMADAIQLGKYPDSGDLHEPDASHPANLISSLAEDGMHYPVLDIDIACRMVPSATPGHCHLYFDDLGLTWEHYKLLLDALATAGILERSYVNACLQRGQTLVRVPGLAKVKQDPQPEVPEDFEIPF